MKQIPDESDYSEMLFSFDRSEEQEIKQTQFLYSYYVTKLKLLKKDNPFDYITKEQSNKEMLYKDMISGCATYLHDLKYISKNNNKK